MLCIPLLNFLISWGLEKKFAVIFRIDAEPTTRMYGTHVYTQTVYPLKPMILPRVVVRKGLTCKLNFPEARV